MTNNVEITTLISVGLIKGQPDFSSLFNLLSINIVKPTNPYVNDSVMTQKMMLKVIYGLY